MTCIVIDDEPLARKGLLEYVEDAGFLEIAGVFEHPLQAADLLTGKRIDLLFLDIQMPRVTGIDFLKSLQHPPLVIFTTAYPQYAVDAFDLNAVDYLLKPFSFERFLKAVWKARTKLAGGAGTPPSLPSNDDHFFIKVDNDFVKLRFEDILFAEARQNYVSIQTAEKKFLTYSTFKSLEDSLPHDRFLKVHKSFVVAIDKVTSISGNEVLLGQHRVPISRSLKGEVMDRLLRGRFLKR